MKLGFYFKAHHLKEWSWKEFQDGDLALSGTDTLALFLPLHLSGLGHDVKFYSSKLGGTIERLYQVQVKNLSEAVECAKAAKVDLLWFGNHGSDETIDGTIACEKLGQPCIVSDGNGPYPEFADLFSRCQSVRRLVCVSASQADNLRDHPVFKKTEFVFANALKPEYPSDPIDRDSMSVCYLGAVAKAKGFQYVAKAWANVKKACPRATLWVLGSGQLYNSHMSLGPLGIADDTFERSEIIPYLGATHDEAAKRGVHFLGLASPQLVQSVLKRCSICIVNPGSFETFCVAAIEGSAAGAAVIGADLGGLRETIIHNRTGLRIKSGNKLAPAIINLLRNPDQARALGAEGQRWAKATFSRDSWLNRWVAVFESAFNDEPAMPPEFSWQRATARVILMEGIRQLNRLPFVKGSLPSLHQTKRFFNKQIKRQT